SPPFRRAGNGSRTNSLPPTSKKQQSASKPGLKITHQVSSPRCARWTNKCAHRRKKRPKIGLSTSLTNQNSMAAGSTPDTSGGGFSLRGEDQQKPTRVEPEKFTFSG